MTTTFIATIHARVRRPLALAPSLALLLVWLVRPVCAWAQTPIATSGTSDYRNTLYNPAPEAIPGVTLRQPGSVSLFSGHVGAAGDLRTPTDKTVYLVRSSIGFPVATVGKPDVAFGGEMLPPSNLGASLEFEPGIDPASKAFYIKTEKKLIAAEPGYVNITWKDSNGQPLASIRYLVSDRAVEVEGQPVVVLYHTHAPSALFTNLPPQQTQAPAVVPPAGLTTVFHWNSSIPYDPTNPVLTNSPSRQLIAKERTGLIVLEYRDSRGVYAGHEIVSVRSDQQLDGIDTVEIGAELAPNVQASTPVPPVVSTGIDKQSQERSFVYQHEVPESKLKGHVFAIKRTESPAEIEVYWKRKSVQGVEWPYELKRYSADWPRRNPAHYQVYVRGSTSLVGPDVDIPTNLQLNPVLMPFREPADGSITHTASLNAGTFRTVGAGWSLLRFQPGADVAFRVVRSVLHTNGSLFDLTPKPWAIGTEVTESAHRESDLVPRPGYIHALKGEDRFDWETYQGTEDVPAGWKASWTTRQIFPVNAGPLEVWWSNVDANRIQWPSLVKRYNATWPNQTDKIIIASGTGTGLLREKNPRIYSQNLPDQPGFNPNDEHAFFFESNSRLNEPSGLAVFALRDDLGSPQTSEPYVLLKYQDAAKADRWAFRIFQVMAESGTNTFDIDGFAGKLLQPPYPLNAQPSVGESRGVSGPFWRDRKLGFWAKAAGDDGGKADIVMRYHYAAKPGFYFPSNYFAYFPTGVTTTNLPPEGSVFPWLDLRPGGTPKTPTDIRYHIAWPEVPTLAIGETLVGAKHGLPSLEGADSVDILYQQGLALGQGESVKLIDFSRRIVLSGVNELPSDVPTASEGGRTYFSTLPPDLRPRIWHDPVNKSLNFVGVLLRGITGEDSVLLNVVSARDRAVLLGLSQDPVFRSRMTQLADKAASAIEVAPNTPFDRLALTAGLAKAGGYVTVALQNSTNLVKRLADPVSLAVIKIECPLYMGEIKVIKSDGPFDEKITLRHSGDFAGHSEDYIFEWRTLPPRDGGPQKDRPFDQWTSYPTKVIPGLQPGQGAVEITIEGAGLFTLTDNYFVCRYRPVSSTALCGPSPSAWCAPQLAEGWIKRVVGQIDPFKQRAVGGGLASAEARFSKFQEKQVNSLVSMIAQAGARFSGSIPLNSTAADSFGLIEIYETVFRRGLDLSVNGTPAVDYAPANDALLLAAGRLADLYLLLGNEAYADASDPTIAFGTEDGQYASEASSIHCFMNQTSSLLEEELALLRGRDDSRLPNPRSTSAFPFYNRLVWNFTHDINGGEVAYALNYNIQDQNNDGKPDGTINEADARRMYPQGHGDAWGQYLTAMQPYYRLLQNPNFTWEPRPEAVLVGGAAVSVDYFDERKFAKAAAAKAQVGAEIVNLTYRSEYVEDPSGQWQGYRDSNKERAWGVSEWASRAGMAALFDWAVGNALLPEKSTKSGIEKIDRSSVTELREVAASLSDIEAQLDKADAGLNPLGLAKNVVPFDIDPTGIQNGKTHFEQIYERAVQSMNNAIAVFNHANNSTQLLRRQADREDDFRKGVLEREADFNNRLIEVFGYPYDDDLGPGGAYPSDYDGPDLYHYDCTDISALMGVPAPAGVPFSVEVHEPKVNPDGSLVDTSRRIPFHVSTNGFGVVKNPGWVGKRRATGEIQRSRSDLLQAKGRFDKALVDYDNLMTQIESQAGLLRAQYRLNTQEILLLNAGQATQETLNDAIRRSRERQFELQTRSRMATLVQNALAEANPKAMGVIAGLANGVIGDFTSAIRSALMTAGTIITEVAAQEGNRESLAELDHQQAKELAGSVNNIRLTSIRQEQGIQQQLAQLEQLVRQEASTRLELYTIQEAMQQASQAYLSVLARGQRLIEDRTRFRQQTAAQVQQYRYTDMAFRLFRSDAIQKYRAQFDLAALYVYLAAKAYDFETNLRPGDRRGPGEVFMTDIVRARTIGLIQNGQPLTGRQGLDGGLSDPMAKMSGNWGVLKGQLGFNNPSTETGRFSLRSELFRIQAGVAGGSAWREKLSSFIVPNLLALPEFQRYCIPFSPRNPTEPALVIPFNTTVNFGQNFFGWPAGGGDNGYDSTAFTTKIRSVGVWFANYNNLGGGMVNAPRVYLVPVGNDVMRSPTDNTGETREWTVLDQVLPVPFPLSSKNDPSLAVAGWIPSNEGLREQFADVRRFGSFRAYHDSGAFDPSQTINNNRLIGRSVWNTRWLLIIPAGTLHSDRNEALQRFINGALQPNGSRDGNGVADIKLFFQTYAYSGN